MSASPAIFLDRDDTVIRDVPYLADPSGLAFLPHAIEGMRLMQELGYQLFIVSNQSGLARGLISPEQFSRVNQTLLQRLNENGIKIAKSYYCPHHPDFGQPCNCRKPLTGMLSQACREFAIDCSKSYVIGDSDCDMGMAENFGLPAIFIMTRQPPKTTTHPYVFSAPDLLAAANWLQKNERQP